MDYPGPWEQEASVPVETSVNALPAAQMFALWGIRLWVAAYRNNGALLPQLRAGFVSARLPQSWLLLDEFLTRLLGSTRRPLDIYSVQAARVSADEQGLLHWLAALQREDTSLPSCPHAQAIAAPARKLAKDFAQVGLIFVEGEAPPRN